ncbi:hypothetical protein BH23CHL3_BH23CHL3_11330 [soil metagenome]
MTDSQPAADLAGVHQLYGEIWAEQNADFETEIAKSGNPRSPEVLFDYAAGLDVTDSSRLLDIGSRDAIHAIELVSRFGCQVVAADPVPLHAELARKRLAGAGTEIAARIELSDAAIEQLPFDDASFDLVWARDMLNHVALRPGIAECWRVLRPGAAMLVFQTFATPLMEPGESRRLYENHSIHAENMDQDHFEEVARSVGFAIETHDPITSEWREYAVESGNTDIGDCLMTIARMRRAEHDLVATYGRALYEATIADHLWGVYLLLGKLSSSIYVLRKPAATGATHG